MAVKRSQRQFGIQPIGVNRVAPYNQGIAQEVVSLADQIYSRQYEIAKGDAIERGEVAAAEAPLSSITQLNPDTKVPMAMQLAQDMGRFSRDAFERAALRRFEGAIVDNISAKKSELMARLGESSNAPKLFEKAFSEYLSGLSGDASGYYKQVIVDHGAEHLSDGRTRLHVAQIKRMQAEAKAEAARRHEAAKRNARESGLSGSHFAFEQTVQEARSVEEDASAIGATAPDISTKRGREIRDAYIGGVVSRKLQDPAITPYASDIYQVLASGKNPTLYSLLNAKSKEMIASIEVAFDVDEIVDYEEIAETLKSDFDVAAKTATYISAYAEAQKKRDEAAQKADEAALKALEEANKATADVRIVEQTKLNNEGSSFSTGFTGDPLSIMQEKERLLALDDGLDPNFVSADQFLKIEKETNEGLIQLAKGAISREINRAIGRGATKQELEVYRDILRNPETAASKAALRSLLGQSVYDVVSTQLVSVNGDALSGAVSDILAGVETGINHEANTLKQGMRAAKVDLASLIRSPNASIEEIDNAIAGFEKSFRSVDSMPESLGDLKAQRDQLVKSRRNEEFVTQANTIVSSVNSENLNESVSRLTRLASEMDQDPATVESFALQALNKSVSEDVAREMRSFKQDDLSLKQLSNWSAYLSGTDVNISLPPEQKEFLNELTERSVIVNGKEVSVDRTALASSVSSVYTKLSNSRALTEQYNKKQSDFRLIDKGSYTVGASKTDGRVAYENLLKDKHGVPQISDLMYKPELSDKDVEVLSDIMNNRGILPESIVNATSAFMTGSLPESQMMSFAQRANGLLFFQDSNGNIKLTAGAKLSLGSDASKFTMIVQAVQKLPAGMEAQVMQAAIDQIRLVSTDKELVNKQIYVGTNKRYEDPASLAADLDGIRPEQINEFANLAVVMAGIPTLNAKLQQNLQNVLDTEYVQNNNMYSGWGRGSSSSFSPDRYVEGGIDIVEAYIPQLIESNGLKNVYFEPASRVAIEDFYRGASYIGELVEDTGRTASGKMTISDQITRARGGEGRILYGETFDSTPSSPKYQLLVANELGLIEATGVTFTLRDALKAKGVEMPDLTKKFFIQPNTDPSNFGMFGSVAPAGND